MKIESVTVKMLRSGNERFANDTTELRAILEDGDDWEAIERELRKKAECLIDRHWSEKREAEEAERKARQEAADAEFAKRQSERDEWLKTLRPDDDACGLCDDKNFPCDGCEHHEIDW